MPTRKIIGRVVVGDNVLENAAVVYENGKITYVGEAATSPMCDNTTETAGLIVPGFVDIHVHGGGDIAVDDDPEFACGHHLRHGTTTMCCTMYRDKGIDGMLRGTEKIKNSNVTNVWGVHLEGPYLNPIYGSGSDGIPIQAVYEEYLPLLEDPFIKHITYAPEVPGTDKFADEMAKRDILVSIGHSSASMEQVTEAVKKGARNATHLFDATGASISPTRYPGTIEVDFNAACLSQDEMTYEIICDRGGIHVRYELIRLVKKLVGAERIIGITDCCGINKEDPTLDVNFVNGELYGSCLTMNQSFRNFVSVGFTIPETVKVTSTNAAKLIGVFNKIGSIEVGKYADLVILDYNFDVIEVIKSSNSFEL